MELTPGAEQRIAGSLDRIGEPGGGLRIQRSPKDPNALRTQIVSAPEDDDLVIERGRARVFVASDVTGVAAGVLDVKANGDGFRLVMR